MTELQDTLKRCAEWVERYDRPGQRVGEQNTKAAVIEPVLAALGWSLFDLDEVQREYRRRPTDNPVDYALLLLRKPRLFVEAKGIGENLDDPRWANQTISYATAAGVEWVALTNGAEWRIYNAHAPVPIEDKLFRAVRLCDDVDLAFEVLSLLSKDGMRDNRIEELWRSSYVDRQVYAALVDLFTGTDPARDLINVLAKRVPSLPRYEVRDSLIRARASFDFPSVTPAGGPPARRPTTPTVAALGQALNDRDLALPTAGARRSKDLVSVDERRTTLRDVLATGRLRPGDTIVASYRGVTETAVVVADATIHYRGQPYASLSAAGAAAKDVIVGPDITDTVRATDGWLFWSATDARDGDIVPLKRLRARAAAERSGRDGGI